MRSAFSLLEVVLAIGILTACAILLGELVGIGRRHADSARDLTEAQNLCENQLAQILCGLAPLERVDGAEIADAPGWTCSVRIEPVPETALRAVSVSVRRTETLGRRAPEFSIVRWTNGAVHEAGAPGEHPRRRSESQSLAGRGLPDLAEIEP